MIKCIPVSAHDILAVDTIKIQPFIPYKKWNTLKKKSEGALIKLNAMLNRLMVIIISLLFTIILYTIFKVSLFPNESSHLIICFLIKIAPNGNQSIILSRNVSNNI